MIVKFSAMSEIYPKSAHERPRRPFDIRVVLDFLEQDSSISPCQCNGAKICRRRHQPACWTLFIRNFRSVREHNLNARRGLACDRNCQSSRPRGIAEDRVHRQERCHRIAARAACSRPAPGRRGAVPSAGRSAAHRGLAPSPARCGPSARTGRSSLALHPTGARRSPEGVSSPARAPRPALSRPPARTRTGFSAHPSWLRRSGASERTHIFRTK